MPIWERYAKANTLGAQGVHANDELFLNKEDTDYFQNADVVVVDGIITVVTDTDDLVGVRLLVVNENFLDAELTEDDPTPGSPLVYYTWFAARGPLVFRLRSKKTIPVDHKLWLQTWKALGSTATIIRVGLLLLYQVKH